MDSAGAGTIEKLAASEGRNQPATLSADAAKEFTFADRHIGPNENEIEQMLREVGFDNLDEFIDATIPENIRFARSLDLPLAKSESEALAELRGLAAKNRVARSFIGAGYYDTITPSVIQRNVLENPGWYTAYTPYQAELAQGRLEALLNFQTMVSDLTGLDIANASLLDESTAAAEAMTLCHAIASGRTKFFAADNCHPKSSTRARSRWGSRSYRLTSPISTSTTHSSARLSNIRRRTVRSKTMKRSQFLRTGWAHCSSSPPIFWLSPC